VTGTFCAIIAYRKNFAALWDFRFNHILLPRRSLPLNAVSIPIPTKSAR
jgi:hypothetical protein